MTDSRAAEIVAGLTGTPKRLPPKLFYDELGSALFGAITKLPWYTPTWTEREVLTARAAEIAGELGPDVVIVEPGAGLCEKIAWLLPSLDAPRRFVPIDIDGATLAVAARRLRRAFPALEVTPLEADFTRALPWPDVTPGVRQVLFYPGSTLGNLSRAEAVLFLRRVAEHLRPGDRALLGVDLVKPTDVQLEAYDDPVGVTAAFNRNILAHVARIVDTDLDPRAFEHRAVWNADEAAVEMHLVARRALAATVAGRAVPFAAGESIHTESSHKYTLAGLDALALEAGYAPRHAWTDARGWFAVVAWSLEA